MNKAKLKSRAILVVAYVWVICMNWYSYEKDDFSSHYKGNDLIRQKNSPITECNF